MSTATRTQRSYDHRLRRLVQATGDLRLATRRGVPASTARGWLRPQVAEVVSIDAVDHDLERLQRELALLRCRIARLRALLRLAIVILRVTGFSLRRLRIAKGEDKRRLSAAIARARSHVSLNGLLRVIGLSPSRYHGWNRDRCGSLDDRTSCPRSSPQQLTRDEVATIRDMVTSADYRHVPTSCLARHAQRTGKVFASPATWHRLVRLHKWRRCRQRIHPGKPKVGVRAAAANEVWHVDTTLIRLSGGGRAYLHAVIDNYSRRILAWSAASSFEPAITARLLRHAAESSTASATTVLVDGGIENFNAAVDEVVASSRLNRVLAQTEIDFSNSLIESWWRSLKHQWLFLHALDGVATVERLVSFYVDQHNEHLPHSAFQGQTPNEMYFGTGKDVPQQLEASRRAARELRIESNRAQVCATCRNLVGIAV